MPRNRWRSDSLVIIAWNIWEGTSAKAARIALAKFIREYRPEVFVIMEARNLYGDLESLGYSVIQLEPNPKRPGNISGDGDIALLIRNSKGGPKIKKTFVLRMKTFWKGPKHGFAQDPRVYRWVLLKWKGRVWKIGAAHTPFGEEARSESRFALIRWLKKTKKGRPTVLVIDANMKLDEFDKTIADPGDAEASGVGIDLEAHKNCRLLNSQRLDRGPSDHPAKRYEFDV